MRSETSPRPWTPLVALLLSAGLAVWLLLQPGLLRDLSLPLRLPLMGLGIWALGAGFVLGVGLLPEGGRWQRYLGEPLCWWLLGGFTLVVVVRALWA